MIAIPTSLAKAAELSVAADGCAPRIRYIRDHMIRIGSNIVERGTVVLDGDQLIFRRELGGRWLLESDRVAHAHAGKLVTIRAVVVGAGLVRVEAINSEI